MLERSTSVETLLPRVPTVARGTCLRETWAIGEITPRISGILRIVP